MSPKKKPVRTSPRQNPHQHAPISTTSRLRSNRSTVRSAGAKKKTRGKTQRAVTQCQDSGPSPVSPVSHTPTHQTPNTAGHLTQNSTAPSLKNTWKAGRGRTKKSEKAESPDSNPSASPDSNPSASPDSNPSASPDSNPSASPDSVPESEVRQTQQQKADTPTHTRRVTRATKELLINAPLSCPGSQLDKPKCLHKPDPGVTTLRRGRGSPPKPRPGSSPQCSRTPPSEPQEKLLSKQRLQSLKPEAQQRKRMRKAEQEVCDKLPVKRQRKKRVAKAELPQDQRIRTRFVLQESDHLEAEDTLSSSDVSLELSVQEDKLSLTHPLSLEDEDEEEEELPSFLQIRQKPSIREGLCVWCKLRKYPFWPAMVKSVNLKSKKASIVFIDQFLFNQQIPKGLWVSLRTLKPFDCEESDRFVDLAKEKYGETIIMCLELISDYRIRIACRSFVGSFIEYIADDISRPLRNKYPKALSSLQSPTQSLMEEQDEDSVLQDLEGHPDLFHGVHVKKKLLPDRTQAARNRANQRLVDFIVKKRGAQKRLLAVISGQETSRWLQALNSSSRLLVEQVYLEDEEQVDEVYHYLETLCESADTTKLCPEKFDRIRFILDVLFPEALICAIASEDHLSMDKAEEKYRQGPRPSNRERQEFDLLIEQQMKLESAEWSD